MNNFKSKKVLTIGSGHKKHLFEYGDYLTKIAEEEIKGNTPSEIKKGIEDIMHKKISKYGQNASRITIKILVSRKKTGENYQKTDPNADDFRTEIASADGIINIQESVTNSHISAKIPFFFRDGKLLPFDIIEMGGRKFVYTDHNLTLITAAMHTINKNPNILNEDSSFEQLDDFVNNTTDDGNLRDVLNIRNREMASSMTGIDSYASIIDESLEKTAYFQPVTKNMIKTINDHAYNIAREVIENNFEKTAGDMADTSERILQTSAKFTEFKSLPWKAAKTIENASPVQILDFDKNRENLKLKDAFVFKDRKIILPDSWDKEKSPAEILSSTDVLIIDEVGNYKVLRSNTKIYNDYKLVDNSPKFRPESKTLAKLIAAKEISTEYDKKFMIIQGEQVFGPIKIRKHNFNDGDCPPNVIDDASVTIADGNAADVFKDIFFEIKCDVLPGDTTLCRDRRNCQLAAVKEDTECMTLGSLPDSMAFLENIYKTDEELEMIANNFDERILWINKETLFIHLNDQIITPVTDIKQIILEGSDDDLRKIAGNDKVVLRKPVADKDNYTLELSKGPRDKRMFRNIDQQEGIAIMKNAGIDHNEVIGMFGFLDAGEREIVRFLPVDLSRLNGDDVVSKGKNMASKLMGKYFNPGEAKKAISTVFNETSNEVLANQLASKVLDKGPDAYRALEHLTSLASDAEALADRFEKIAIDCKSKDFQNIAKLMVVTGRVDRFLQKSASETLLWDVRDALDSVSTLSDPIEKSAAMLYDLSQQQDVMGNNVVGRNTVLQSLRTLDRLNSYVHNFQ